MLRESSQAPDVAWNPSIHDCPKIGLAAAGRNYRTDDVERRQSHAIDQAQPDEGGGDVYALWLRRHGPIWLLLPAAAGLALFVWLLTLHPAREWPGLRGVRRVFCRA